MSRPTPELVQRPPNGDEPNYIRQTHPTASLSNGSQDELEIETGISIADREILRYLGLVGTDHWITVLNQALQNPGGSSSVATAAVNVQTRTGEEFQTADPELIHRLEYVVSLLSNGTNGVSVDNELDEAPPPQGGQLVGSPRLVILTRNDAGGGSFPADSMDTRIGYEFEEVDTGTFVQLAEQHADIFFV